MNLKIQEGIGFQSSSVQTQLLMAQFLPGLNYL